MAGAAQGVTEVPATRPMESGERRVTVHRHPPMRAST